jgi:hypothetical protein
VAEALNGEASDVDWAAFAIGGIGEPCNLRLLYRAALMLLLMLLLLLLVLLPWRSGCVLCQLIVCHEDSFCAVPCPLCLPAVPGEVHAAKEYGLLCDLEAHADVVGLAALHQVGGRLLELLGSSVMSRP